jgi:hypothetical protein
MSMLMSLVKHYNAAAKSKGFKGFSRLNEIPASKKWAEYSVDEYKIRELMKGAEFIERFEAEKALKVVRGKIEWMYKHENFNLSEATSMYKKLKRLSA